MRIHLTELAVKQLKSASAVYWDKTTPGFGIRVGKHARTWVVIRGRSRERTVVGRYPDLSLSAARLEARKLLVATPERKIESVLYKEAQRQFLDENYRECSQRSKAEAARHLNKHFAQLPSKLSDIDDTHVKKCLDKLTDTPSEQLHAYRTIRCFLRWCVRPPRKFIKHSPMEGYEPPSKDRRGTRILSDDELGAVWKAAEAPPHRVVRLLILWGTRNSETVSIERRWVRDGVLTIPGSHTKNRRDHSVPILPLALETLRGFPPGRHYVLSRWGDSHLSEGAWSKIKRDIQAASGTGDWQLRDLRRTFRSNMARLRVPRDLCEVLINHAPPVLDEIYDRYDRLDEKREALEKYETWLQTLFAPEVKPRGSRASQKWETRDAALIEEASA